MPKSSFICNRYAYIQIYPLLLVYRFLVFKKNHPPKHPHKSIKYGLKYQVTETEGYGGIAERKEGFLRLNITKTIEHNMCQQPSRIL